MQYILIFFVSLFLSACSEPTPPTTKKFTIESTSNPEDEKAANSVLPKLIRACPGLDRYAADLTPAKAYKTQQIDFEGGTEIQFSVVSNPSSLPSDLKLRSASNRCYITISKDQTIAYIGKQACHSICNGIWQENSPNLMGRELKLQ